MLIYSTFSQPSNNSHAQREAGDASGRTVGDVNDENRVKQLKKEIAVRYTGNR